MDEKEAWLRARELQLKEREEKVRQMEDLACDAHDALIHCIEQEVAKKYDHFSEVGNKLYHCHLGVATLEH